MCYSFRMPIDGAFDVYSSPEAELKRRNNELEDKVHIDDLTQLFTRGYLREKLNELIEELNNSKTERVAPLQAIFILRFDIDKFKLFNESPYNHTVGDDVLRAFAKYLKGIAKEKEDIVARKGGDEFAIVMPIFRKGVNLEELFETIKKRMKELFVLVTDKNGKERDLKVTASIGYSAIQRGEFKTSEELIKEADIKEREDKENQKSPHVFEIDKRHITQN
ncbi:MAG: Periplasmic/7TM domain sensor diguanylate cyclase [Parcubacteria group bacterium GW2011_GWF1_40_6]|uniref:Periplasmic/7TM domain sensor diguanylate cyclase n=2 Tax=Candidatus Nomuraibacteriota TaxID=1752729 RepID=A0A0G0R188_9BACT|nr:MAG: Periplasmic/7TM domain sensor diguanylate cyclase [Candidatus Nomurabacteria bacterium GW2011_GWF2_40_12]KKR67880.1 MAG: Periplasmic/7TM domain sensor diguanylate cyclase [Parcubacteria group bacterium GW2011_GWF1_40_6]